MGMTDKVNRRMRIRQRISGQAQSSQKTKRKIPRRKDLQWLHDLMDEYPDHPLFADPMRFTIDRLTLARMLEAVARRAPLRGRRQKLVRLTAAGARVYVEANGKAAGAEAMVFTEGTCVLVHETIRYLLRTFARGRRNITFGADIACFHIDEDAWPVAAFQSRVSPPAEYEDFPMSGQN
jgi:hypothetical protein